MARLIPQFIEPYLKRMLIATPKSLRLIICMAYWKLLRVHYSTQVWYRYGRHYDAPLEPFKIIQMDPERINYTSGGGNSLHPLIKNGNWDNKRQRFNETIVYKTFHEHFVLNKPWSETEQYQLLIYEHGNKNAVLEYIDDFAEELEMFNNVDTKQDIANKYELKDIFNKYDEIFDEIKKEGYLIQQDIKSIDERLENPGVFSSAVPEKNEITVDVGRDGAIGCYQGNHRVAMANILELDSVPVRIRLRHEQWQQKRDAVWRGEEPPEDHPDLQLSN